MISRVAVRSPNDGGGRGTSNHAPIGSVSCCRLLCMLTCALYLHDMPISYIIYSWRILQNPSLSTSMDAPGKWTCVTCPFTFINDGSSAECNVCKTPRPPSVPQQQQQQLWASRTAKPLTREGSFYEPSPLPTSTTRPNDNPLLNTAMVQQHKFNMASTHEQNKTDHTSYS